MVVHHDLQAHLEDVAVGGRCRIIRGKDYPPLRFFGHLFEGLAPRNQREETLLSIYGSSPDKGQVSECLVDVPHLDVAQTVPAGQTNLNQTRNNYSLAQYLGVQQDNVWVWFCLF